MIRHVFIAHPKSLPEPELQDFVARVQAAFRGRTLGSGEPLEITITTGRESAEAWASERTGQAFNWPGWIQHVTGLTASFGGEPRYHYFVVGPEIVIGRATADLVAKALANKRRVFGLDNADNLRVVAGVDRVNDQDWKRGWAIRFRY